MRSCEGGREGSRDKGSRGIDKNGHVKKKKGGFKQRGRGMDEEKNTIKKQEGRKRNSVWSNELGQVERRRRRRESAPYNLPSIGYSKIGYGDFTSSQPSFASDHALPSFSPIPPPRMQGPKL